MRGFKMQATDLLFVLFISFTVMVCIFYFRKDTVKNTDQDDKISLLSSQNDRILTYNNKNKELLDAALVTMNDFNKRLDAVEKIKPIQMVELHLKEPINVRVLQKRPEAKVVKSPLLDRAGITKTRSKENN